MNSNLKNDMQVSAVRYLFTKRDTYLEEPVGHYKETRALAVEIREFVNETVDRIFDIRNGNLRISDSTEHQNLKRKYTIEDYKDLKKDKQKKVVEEMISSGLKHFECRDKVYEYYDVLREVFPDIKKYYKAIEESKVSVKPKK